MAEVLPFIVYRPERQRRRVLDFKVSTDTEVLFCGRDMRAMADLLCGRCRHEWTQPKAGGTCPKCHAVSPIVVSRRVNRLERM
jgi:hypothetical protein